MLTQADLLAPKGRVEGKSFFPDLSSTDLAARLEEYLAQGYARATDDAIVDGVDAAVERYVMYRVFDAVYLNFISNPLTSTTTEGGSAQFAMSQAEKFRELADAELVAYEAYIPEEVVEAARPSSTAAVKNSYNW